jgi:hypothetical protein
MSFHVGQKVVCVNGAFYSHTWFDYVPHRPETGVVYTVRAFGEAKFTSANDCCLETHPAVLLMELVNPEITWKGIGLEEQMFPADRFRPLISKSTEAGMAILREILDRESVDERKQVPIRTA